MNNYELVVLIDSKLSSDDIKSIKEKVEKIVEKQDGKIKDRDDIGFMDMYYAYGSDKNDKAYFYSLFIEIGPEKIYNLRQKINIIRGIIKWKLFKMKKNEKFLKFAELNKMIVDNIQLSEGEKGVFNEIDKK